MPLYEYECADGHRFEVIQKFSDDPLESCSCGAKANRILSASNFALKGDGWSRDGYTKKGDDRDFAAVANETKKQILKRDYGVDA